MGKLTGKRAIVTGGASGIGEAIVRLFAAEGADIGIVDMSDAAAVALAAEVTQAHGNRAMSAVADVSDEAAIMGAIGKIELANGPTDILVNSAGIDNTVPLEDMSVAVWDKMIAVHMRGTFLAIRTVLPGMKARKWGRIINFSSQLAHKGSPTMVHYCAAKAGIMGLTRALAHEVGAHGITVNCINPGPIDTPLLRQLPQDWLDVKLSELPIKRFGRTSEVAPTALLLASEDGGYYLGASMNMNGGDYML